MIAFLLFLILLAIIAPRVLKTFAELILGLVIAIGGAALFIHVF